MMHSAPSATKQKPDTLTPLAAPARITFEAIGTWWAIDIFQELAAGRLQDIERKVRRRIGTFDRNYSRFRADSLVADMTEPGMYRLPADGKKLFDWYAVLYAASGGKVTPLIGTLLSDAGYDAHYSLQPKTLRAVPAWEEALDYEFPLLTTKIPVLIDVGAAGKGYLADIVGVVLRRAGVTRFSINAGGDIVVRDAPSPLRIGLEHPDRPERMIGIAELSDGSICGSAGNRRAWAGFHHIMDPSTHRSPRLIQAAWAVARDGLHADGLATALFFTSPTVLQRYIAFEYAIMYQDGTLEHSAGFPAVFFTADPGEGS